MANFLQKIESFFGFGPKPALSSSEFQTAINTAGQLVDELEAVVDKFGPLTALLPGPFAGYLSAVTLAVHGIDAYVDTLESAPASTPPPPAPVATPDVAATPTPTPTPTPTQH